MLGAAKQTDRLPLQLARAVGLAPFLFGDTKHFPSSSLWWFSLSTLCLYYGALLVQLAVSTFSEAVWVTWLPVVPRVALLLRFVFTVSAAVLVDAYTARRQYRHLLAVLDGSVVRAYLWRPASWTALPHTSVDVCILLWNILNCLKVPVPWMTIALTCKEMFLSAELSLFIFLLDTLSHRYRDLCIELQYLPEVRSGGGDFAKRVVQVRRQHKEATDLLARLCFIFGPQVAAILLYRGGNVVLNMFLMTQYRPDMLWSYYFYTVYSMILVKDITSVLQTLWMADKTCQQGNQAMLQLHELQNLPHLKEEEVMQLDLFCAQLYEFPVKVSVCRLMNLNFHGTLNAANAIVTFFIALLQFRETKPTRSG